MNLYAYVQCDPINNFDFNGLRKCPDFKEKCDCGTSLNCWIKKCLKANSIADEAEKETMQHFPSARMHNDRADAWRHCYLSCRLTREVGYDCAKDIGDNHEECNDRHTPSPKEKAMDLHNNNIGRILGQQSLGSCAYLCHKALDQGGLKNKP